MNAVYALTRRFFKRRRTTFHDLPSEILSEVALYLDFADILSLQQTSRKLRESVEARIVWLTLAKKYSARHFHLCRPETGALGDLKTDELREWIQKRLIVDEIWKARTVQPRFRTLPDRGPNVLKLVPGGRWLLVGFGYGRVYYYDLDSEDLKRTPLIKPAKGKRGSFQEVNALDIYVDQDMPVLQFKVGMSGIDPSSSSDTLWLHVWQVRLKDGNSLAAEWLISVPIYFLGAGLGCLALEQRLLARTVSPWFQLTWVEVYWWRQCSSTHVLRTVFPVARVPDDIYVIGNRILCLKSPATLELYDLPEPEYLDVEETLLPYEDTLPPDEEVIPAEPLWSYSFEGGGWMCCSSLYHDDTRHRLVVSTSQGIWGLVFSETEDPPTIVQLSTFPNQGSTCVPGICKAYALYGEDDTGVRIGYSWDNEDDAPAMRYSSGEPRNVELFGRYPAFDEEGGRFVYLHGADTMVITVVDLFNRIMV